MPAAKKKPAPLKKPMLSKEAVIGFAEEGRSSSKLKATADAEVSDNSRFPPGGDIRLTVNIRADLHMRLKMEAVKRRTTVGEILEDLVEQNIKG